MIVDHEELSRIRKEKTGLEEYSAPAENPPPAYGSTSSSVVLASSFTAPSVPTNGVHVLTMLEPIRGSWLLDPLAPQSSSPSIVEKIVENRVAGGRRSRRVRNLLSGAPTAKLDSRHGNISAAFRVVGESVMPANATIRSTTRSGNIVLELVSKSPTRTVHFDAYSRTGNISLLIPRSFSGVVELRARRGDTELLPALAASARIMRASDQETVVFVGGGAFPQAGPSSNGDLARLCTRSGLLRLGFSGEDAFIESEGVMAKAVNLFQKLTTKSAAP
ncbi:hypothetical protein F5148DRAFT_571172 [Russula earlei]|uniref:Uncharacterized protein n=1 Tax=Russula earlei TaxID=71964 RepID=A0ACC0UGS6_9AGAM|nr:hypothetical protein F5148DRAFT_571172 [Russula earlei]